MVGGGEGSVDGCGEGKGKWLWKGKVDGLGRGIRGRGENGDVGSNIHSRSI